MNGNNQVLRQKPKISQKLPDICDQKKEARKLFDFDLRENQCKEYGQWKK